MQPEQTTSSSVRPEGLSVQMVAMLLDVHENTVYNWIKDDIIVAVRVGRRLLRIPRSEISRLRSSAAPPTTDTNRSQHPST
jgi:excisionase family DNA binding protein